MTRDELGNLSATLDTENQLDLTITIEGKEFHLGYSRLDKFMGCPSNYKRTYVDGVRKPGGVPARRGQAYHGTLEGLLNYKINRDGDLYPWPKTEKFALKNAANEKLSDAESHRVVEAVKFYYVEHYPKHQPVSVEDSFDFTKNGIRYTGRIDLLNILEPKVLEITDHKFSYDTWADERAHYGVQPIIYQWAWEEELRHRFPNFSYGGFAYNIIRLFPTPLIQTIRIEPVNQEQSAWWEEQITTMAKIMVLGLYPAFPNAKACKWCDHKKECKPCKYKLAITKTGEEDLMETEDR